MLPVQIGDRIAQYVSNTEDRWDNVGLEQVTRSDLLQAWAIDTLQSNLELDLVLLGHTHQPLVREPEPGRWYVNSGDWVFHQSYVILNEGEPPLLLDWRER
jgi:UDP-2,3-diacylglucosamine pyrophosphatase LpxH